MLQKCEGRTDEELVSLSLKDQEFFYCLLSRFEDKLLRYLFRTFSFSREDAEDVLQESFLKIYKNLNEFDNSFKFSSWAYRIVHNEAVSFLRKAKTKSGQNSYLSDEEFEKISSDINLEKEVDRKYSKEKIGLILKNLEEKYREVLVLKFLEDKSYEEISDIVKKPVGTVATLINRAKKQFKKIIEENHV
jgi:RNA polymerase sigma-70 factor (ECF subfamily)